MVLNYDYSVNLEIFNDILILIENNKFYSSYDLIKNKLIMNKINLPDNKYINILNNSLIYLDEQNILYALNPTNNNYYWNSHIDNFINKNDKIIKITESHENILIFLDNGSIIFLNKLDGSINKKLKFGVKNIHSIYLQKEFIFVITENANLYIFE